MLEAGTLVAGFRIDGFLGRGGMGVVYRATQLSLEREVALKLVSPELSAEPEFRERFRREGKIQAALDHPNIVPVYEAGESAHGFFIAMRLIPGVSLRHLIRSDELDPVGSLEILAGVARGLDAAHADGLIHRDVKPHNILVVQRQGFLADFGLSKARDLTSSSTADHNAGTLAYIAPERIRGERADRPSDVYALGAVLYECLTGSVPFLRTSDVEVMYAHLHTPIPSVRLASPELPESLDDVLRRAMSKNPDVRQPSATELIDEATEALEGRAPTPPSPTRSRRAGVQTRPLRGGDATANTPGRGRESRGQHRGIRRVTIVALAVAIAVAAGGFAVGRSGRPSSTPTHPLLNSGVSIQVPRNWQSVVGAFSIKQLAARPIVAAGPPGQTRAGILVGRATAFGPTMLPAVFYNFVRGAADRYPARTTSGVEGLLYPNIRSSAHGGQRLTVFAVPTTGGDIVVACITPVGGDRRVTRACARAMNSFTLLTGFAFALEPRVGYGQFLSATLRRLLAQTSHGLTRYGAGRDAASQAAAADDIAAAYAAAAKQFSTLTALSVSPQDVRVHNALREALTAAGSAYINLATATRNRNLAAWRDAHGKVVAAVDQLGAELDELQKLGYSLG